MNGELASLTSGTAPEDMSRVLRALFLCKQAGKLVKRGRFSPGFPPVNTSQRAPNGLPG